MPVVVTKEIKTPLGTLEAGVEVVESAETIRASCVVEANFPKLTKYFGVDAIRRAHFQIEILDDIAGLCLFLRWQPEYSWERCSGVGAQHFEGQQYTAGDCTVDIGSDEDLILLRNSIRDGGSLPERFALYLQKLDEILDALASDDVDEVEDIEWLRFAPEGLLVDLPALHKGETVTIAFTASWFTGKYGDGRGQTCFAADAALAGDVPWDERWNGR